MLLEYDDLEAIITKNHFKIEVFHDKSLMLFPLLLGGG